MQRIILVFAFCLYLDGTAVANDTLRLATTTSTENSGLLSRLNPPFEQQNDVDIHVIAVGTGQSLQLGEAGDVDLVFVHAPEAERKFVDSGYGIERTAVMHNDFVLLGPENDPAQASTATTLREVLLRIYRSQSSFISRGDDSGNHKKEQVLWEHAGVEPRGTWYQSVGQGMGAVLQIAHEKQAYTLSDRGTYLAYLNKINLEVIYENDKLLDNPYHIILVNPEKHPHVKTDLARKYVDFVTGEEGQRIIREFRINNQQLFYPDVIK